MPKSPAVPAEAKRIMAQLLKMPPKSQNEMKIGRKSVAKATQKTPVTRVKSTKK